MTFYDESEHGVNPMKTKNLETSKNQIKMETA